MNSNIKLFQHFLWKVTFWKYRLVYLNIKLCIGFSCTVESRFSHLSYIWMLFIELFPFIIQILFINDLLKYIFVIVYFKENIESVVKILIDKKIHIILCYRLVNFLVLYMVTWSIICIFHWAHHSKNCSQSSLIWSPFIW